MAYRRHTYHAKMPLEISDADYAKLSDTQKAYYQVVVTPADNFIHQQRPAALPDWIDPKSEMFQEAPPSSGAKPPTQTDRPANWND